MSLRNRTTLNSIEATISLARVQPSSSRWAIAFAFSLAAMLLMAVIMPIDHDEGQYVAAAALMAKGARPYLDFIYLQTPLQPEDTWPVVAMAPGYALLALRFVNAVLAAGILAIVYNLQRQLGVESKRAGLATMLLGACYAFQFSAGVARNDLLPAFAEVLALAAGIAAIRSPRHRLLMWALAGLGLGAAVSAKISYAIPLAAAGLFLIASVIKRTATLNSLIAFGSCALMGLAPCISAVATPQVRAVLLDTLVYHMTAPMAAYAAIGEAWRTSALMKLPDAVVALVVGPALEVLIAVGVYSYLDWKSPSTRSHEQRFVEVMAVAGFLAAIAPTPIQRQYFLPLLPPLFIIWGLGSQRWNDHLRPDLRKALSVAVTFGAIVGAGRYSYLLADSAIRLSRGELPPPMQLTAEAHWIGERLRAAGAVGDVVSPSPQVVVDSGYPIDPRFASGAFFFRTGDLTSDADQVLINGLSPRTLKAGLNEAPPAAIVIGYEGPEGPAKFDVDGFFRAYAIAAGYKREVSPFGQAELYTRPTDGQVTTGAGPYSQPSWSQRAANPASHPLLTTNSQESGREDWLKRAMLSGFAMLSPTWTR